MLPEKSISVDSNDLRTRFSNTLGVYSPEDQTITWTADNGIRIVSYPKGRKEGVTPVYPAYEKGNYLERMLQFAKTEIEDGLGIFRQTFTAGVYPFARTVRRQVVFDERYTPIVTSFTRHPQAEVSVLTKEFDPSVENDLSTPYSSNLSKQMMQKVGLYLSSFALAPKPYKTIHDSIQSYFSAWKPDYAEWAEFADRNYLKAWADKGEWLEGHPTFSTMAWATVSKFILGLSEDEFVDYSHVWNTILPKNCTTLWQSASGTAQQLYAIKYSIPQLQEYVLKKIRETQSKLDNHEEIAEKTIIHYWLKNDIAKKILDELPHSDLEETCEIAQKRNITVNEMVYLDNFFGVMIGMQETIAFVLTQIACQFARNESYRKRCEENLGDCRKMVSEVLRFMPPAGIARELRWDTDIVDEERGKTYPASKGDQFVTMPALAAHLEKFTLEHEVFDIDRPHPHSHSQAFSEGPHKCPGQIPAHGWLAALAQELAKYEFSREGQPEPEYYVAFILRDGGMKFKMAHPGQLEESSSSDDEQLLTLWC